EVKGILALAVAGFGLIALATFDPSRPPAVQQSPVGPVGVWLGWAAFQSFGYAGFLFPLLLGAWGASAFVRPPVTRGVLPFTGLAVLLVSAAGLVAQASSALSHGAAERNATIAGGLVGWAVRPALRAGAWPSSGSRGMIPSTSARAEPSRSSSPRSDSSRRPRPPSSGAPGRSSRRMPRRSGGSSRTSRWKGASSR